MSRQPGLYVHLPFCEAKCAYCHFAIDPRKPDDSRQERYLRAVLAEIGSAQPFPEGVDTLYFGGGTPSLLSSDRLARLIRAAADRFALQAGAELTLEANPRDLDLSGYRRALQIGLNRLSLGVQSLDDEVLSEMGRRHTSRDSLEAVEAARRAGFANLSLDLILGWPGETRHRFRRTLDELVALQPEHVSVYILEVEGRTLLSHRAARGQLELPEDDLVADLWLEMTEVLARHGLERYEISNYARPGFESRHNLKYWTDAEFLGFGLSAHSYRAQSRFWNLESYGAYVKAVEERGPAAARAGERRLSEDARVREALFTRLRLARGVDLDAFRLGYGVDLLSSFGEELSRPLEAGLLELSGRQLKLTERGVLISNEVFAALV